MKEKRWGYESEDLQRGDLLMFAISVHYIKSLGHTIVLYTDDDGKKLLGGLPYDEIYTTLNDIPEDISTMMWAYGKFFAMKDEPLGSIHIDGDVFIKSQKCIDKICDGDYDFLCQDLDFRTTLAFGLRIHYAAWKLLDTFGMDWGDYPTEGEYQYNVGILRIMNQQLKDEYFNFFKHITEQVKMHPVASKVIKQCAFCAISVVAEQQFLYEIAVKGGYKVKTLIDTMCGEGYFVPEAEEEMRELGYDHILGARKYHLMDELFELLKNLNPELYDNVKNHEIFQQSLSDEEIRFVHSYWSKPSNNGRWNIESDKQEVSNILIQSLSFAYLKRLNLKTILHTDDKGKKMFSHLPYDEVHLTLNNIPKDIPNYVWAYGKFFAMKDEPLGSVHIDGDVFIKKEECVKRIKEGKYDVLMQNIECEPDTKEGVRIYSWSWDRLKEIKFSDEFDWEHGYFGYNAGIVRLMNQELKDKYFNFYFNSVDDIKQQTAAMKQLNEDNLACPDVILEQQSIFEIINRDSYSIKLLLSNTKDFPTTQLHAKQLGFQHLIGMKKYSLIYRVKHTLSIIDNELYQKTMDHLKNMYGDWVEYFWGIEIGPEHVL
jgi:hypothetical protein